MKKMIFVAALLISVIALGVHAADQNTLVISSLSGKAGNEQVALSWSASPDGSGKTASKFTVYYGTKSVAEGLVSTYESSAESKATSLTVKDLENGVPYYFAVQAIGIDSEGPISNEIRVTPTVGIDGPAVISAKATTMTTAVIEFSEEVVLPEKNPELSFSITEETDESQFLLVWDAEYLSEGEGEDKVEDKTKVVLTTDEQVAGTNYAVTVSALIKDNEGNPIESDVTDSAKFVGSSLEHAAANDDIIADETDIDITDEDLIDDTDIDLTDEDMIDDTDTDIVITPINDIDVTPPENITNLKIDFKQRVTDFLMQLSWVASINTAGDLIDQMLYHSLDKGKVWDSAVSLGSLKTSYEMAGQPETEHTFKITTKDASGNESVGAIESIRLPALPQTGPLALVLAGAGMAIAGINGMRRKK